MQEGKQQVSQGRQHCTVLLLPLLILMGGEGGGGSFSREEFASFRNTF